MKKTIIALATAAVFATSANAATVFEKDGTKVEVNGRFGVVLLKAKEQRTDLDDDGSHLAFGVSHKVNDSLTALGYSKITFAKEDDNGFGNPKLDKLYAGLDIKNVGKLTFGKQSTNGDDVYLNNNSYLLDNTEPQFAMAYDVIYGPVKELGNLLVEADKSIKFRSADVHGFSFGLDYVFGEANKKASGVNLKYAHQASVFYNRTLDNGLGFNLAAGYGVERASTDVTGKTTTKNINWRTAAQMTYGPVAFGAEYGQNKYKFEDVNVGKSTHILVSASLQATEKSKIYTQWRNVQDKFLLPIDLGVDPSRPNYTQTILPGDKITTNTFVLGADYQLHKNVLAYVEYNRVVIKGQRKVLHKEPNSTPEQAITSHTAKQKGDIFGVGLRVLF